MRHHTPLLVALLLAPASAGSIILVDDDAPPGGDGSSWATAYRYLQDALMHADVTEIRVARGTYLPDHSEADPDGSGDRYVSFVLEGDIALRGGYAGVGAPDPDDRDIKAYETILDGDLAGNDGPAFANNGENACRVVVAATDTTALLEGFTIRGGNASNHGGGLFIVGAGPVVSQCTFHSNRAGNRGGAVYVEDGWPRIAGCIFTSNYGDIGGCIHIRGLSDVTVTDCKFEDNEAFAGGGITKIDGNLTIIGCEFRSNVVTDSGGGVINGYGPGVVVSSVFSRNQSSFHSGGMMCFGPGSLVNCVFSENSSSLGGGIYATANPLGVDNCTFSRNSPGGLVVDEYAAPVFTNSILWGNTPDQIGHDPNFPWTPP
ncbi:MAG: right-handed parallel beta-helix repeat-containing protein, partial [Planctomycetota bacterium]